LPRQFAVAGQRLLRAIGIAAAQRPGRVPRQQSLYAHARGRFDAALRKLGAVICWAECSGDFLTPSPPAEKATARQAQAGQASTGDGAGDTNDGRDGRGNDLQ
jgi:hypothetical protein